MSRGPEDGQQRPAGPEGPGVPGRDGADGGVEGWSSANETRILNRAVQLGGREGHRPRLLNPTLA